MQSAKPAAKVSAAFGRTLSAPDAVHRESGTSSRFARLPRELGWLLITAGLIGEIAPGVLGTPFWIAGTLVLYPRIGCRVERWLQRRAPRTFDTGMRQIERFLEDLERRYPNPGGKSRSSD